MTIPADHFLDNGDGTALVVVQPDPKRGGISGLWYPRPCDEIHCHEGYIHHGHYSEPCPDCSGTGRHTFTIKVAHDFTDPGEWDFPHHHDTHRVSVVPGMVLEIYEDDIDCDDGHHIVIGDDYAFICVGPDKFHEFITLPPAAAPGMYAIKLKMSL